MITCNGFKGARLQNKHEWTLKQQLATHDQLTLESLVRAAKTCDDPVLVRVFDGGISLYAMSYTNVFYPVGIIAELLQSGINSIEIHKAEYRINGQGDIQKYDLLIVAGGEYYDLSTDTPPGQPFIFYRR